MKSKLTESDIITIYCSTMSKRDLAKLFKVSVRVIHGIKKKKYYHLITDKINEPVGICKGDKRIPLDPYTVERIFYFEGSISELKKQFHVSATLARNIKTKHTYRNITTKLDRPGCIKIHGLSWDDIVDIRNSDESNTTLSIHYNVSQKTISQIRNMKIRLYR